MTDIVRVALWRAIASLCILGCSGAIAQDEVPLAIIEFMASNSSFLPDPQGEYDDWAEIHNASHRSIDVAGMYLTDDADDPTKWQLPLDRPSVTTISAAGYLVIWADGDTDAEGLHAGFRLDVTGGELHLFDVDGTTLIDAAEYGRQSPDISYGRYPDATGDWRFMGFATPGMPNIAIYQGVVAEPQFSVDRGFYDEPFEVTLTCDTPGALVYYTVDGSEPYEEGGRLPTGTAYQGPIRVTTTTCLRAKAIIPGWMPSQTVTHSYLLTGAVVHQSNRPAGFPTSWSGYPADYEMDPDIVHDPRYSGAIAEALISLPSMSLVMTNDDLFDSSQGIYANSTREGLAWERPGSIELIYPDGAEGFQVNCGVRIQGGWFRSHSGCRKHSFRLLFKGIYGTTKLRYPLFGPDAVDQFDTITLRAGANDGYTWNAARLTEQYTRDEFGRRLQLATGNAGSHGMFVHLYVNGLYWGLYNPCERPDASFSASYYGGEKDHWDSIHDLSVSDGNMTAWTQMIAVCRDASGSGPAYQQLQGNDPDGAPNGDVPHLLDVPNYIDYLIVNLWGGNWDWPWKNWWAARDRSPESTGFKFYCWDYENTMGNNRGRSPLNKNALNNNFSSAGQPHQHLKRNAEYQMLFADRVHRFFFNGGPLAPESLIPRYEAMAATIEQAMIAESARWGDQHHHPPLTQQEWYAERDWVLHTYLPQRTGIALDQFRSAGLYPWVEAPVFGVNGSYQHGGHMASDAALAMVGPIGTVWYTLDGTDPRVPGSTGAAGEERVLVSEAAPKRVLVPSGPVGDAWRGGGDFDDSGWISGVGGVGYERSFGYDAFFEIDVQNQMYSNQTTCLIRIPFTVDREVGASDTLKLRIRYDDGFVAYLNGTKVAAMNFQGEPTWDSAADDQNSDQAAVTLEDIDLSSVRHLVTQGENILALHGLNQSSASSDFLISVALVSSDAPAGGVPSGVSPTAVACAGPVTLDGSAHVKARLLSGATWSALNEATFAVGPVAETLRISEIMYHPADSGDPGDPNTEYVELTNIGAETINLNLVSFTNGIDFTFTSFELPPGDYCLVVRDIAAFEGKYGVGLNLAGRYTGGLSNAGERIELQDAVGQTIQNFRFEDNWYDVTDGGGFSLTVRAPAATDPNAFSEKDAWRPSADEGGSPGYDDTADLP